MMKNGIRKYNIYKKNLNIKLDRQQKKPKNIVNNQKIILKINNYRYIVHEEQVIRSLI